MGNAQSMTIAYKRYSCRQLQQEEQNIATR